MLSNVGQLRYRPIRERHESNDGTSEIVLKGSTASTISKYNSSPITWHKYATTTAHVPSRSDSLVEISQIPRRPQHQHSKPYPLDHPSNPRTLPHPATHSLPPKPLALPRSYFPVTSDRILVRTHRTPNLQLRSHRTKTFRGGLAGAWSDDLDVGCAVLDLGKLGPGDGGRGLGVVALERCAGLFGVFSVDDVFWCTAGDGWVWYGW